MKIAYKAKSIKHASKIIKYLKKSGTNNFKIKPIYVDEYYWLDDCKDLCCTPKLPNGYESGKLPSAPSKKDLQEALSKAGEELSSMNERLGKLEAKNEPKTANGIEIHFDEVIEGLPEKWCIVANQYNIAEIAKWFSINRQYESETDFLDNRFIRLDTHFHFPKLGGNHCYSSLAKGYTEITFETFKKYVLKEEVKEAVGLEVNRWYKDTREGSKALFYIESIVNPVGHQDLTIFSYGFTMSGDWSEGCLRNNSVFTKYFIPATESEVFEALKAEAEKRGFKEGVVVKNHQGENELIDFDVRFTTKHNNGIYINNSGRTGIWLMINGVWSTIITQPEPIDFSKAGQLVEYPYETSYMYITTGTHNGEEFEGLVMYKGVIKSKRNDINKYGLILSSKQLTLKNE